MANLKSSKKKVRKDIKRTKANVVYKSKIDQILHKAKRASTANEKPDIAGVYQLIDKAAKRGILSKQRASRLKSRVASK